MPKPPAPGVPEQQDGQEKDQERKAGKPAFGFYYVPGQTSVRPGWADRFLAPKREGERFG